MHYRVTAAAIIAAALASSAWSLQQQQYRGRSTATKIASALTAAPAEITAGATFAEMTPDGKLVTLRKGTNGWVCMPDTPGTPGPDPMCADKTWQEFFSAYMAKKPPMVRNVGIAYMLAGGADASNTDPFATKPAPGDQWVTTPAHTMVVLPDPRQLESFSNNPSTGGPYIMWKGTPYAHLMVPVAKSH